MNLLLTQKGVCATVVKAGLYVPASHAVHQRLISSMHNTLVAPAAVMPSAACTA